MSSQESCQATEDVQHDDMLASKSMSPLDLFVRDLDERKGKIPCYQEVTEIQKSVENVLKHLLLEVEKENPFFKTTLINSGSFYEGTKVGEPDEFDYFVQLDYFSEPEAIMFDELPRSTVMVTPSELGFRKLSDETPSKYRQVKKEDQFHWKTWIKAPFVEIFNIKAKGFSSYGMEVLARDREGTALERHGPAYCLELKWTGGERYKGLKISVDLSLAVKINSRSLTMDVNLDNPTGKVIKSLLDSLPYYFAVSAYRDREFEVDGFRLRCSQSCLEQALFHHFGLDSGPSVCLRVLKVLRDIILPGDNSIDMLKENVADFESIIPCLRNVLSFDPLLLTFDIIIKEASNFPENNKRNDIFNKWISSYALKTLVLFEWEENPADEQWSGSNLSERLLNILNGLLLCLKEGGLRSFFYNDYNVLPNSDEWGFKEHAVNRITTLQNWILSIKNASKYGFEDCLKNISKEVKLTCHKIYLTLFLCYGLVHSFHHELVEVITGTAKKSDSLILKRNIFCDIYIQALLNKIAPEEKLTLLIDTNRMEETVSSRKAIELFKDIAATRMKGTENLPSYSLWSQEFKSSGDEIAKLFEFVVNIFKKDIEVLKNKLQQS